MDTTTEEHNIITSVSNIFSNNTLPELILAAHVLSMRDNIMHI